VKKLANIGWVLAAIGLLGLASCGDDEDEATAAPPADTAAASTAGGDTTTTAADAATTAPGGETAAPGGASDAPLPEDASVGFAIPILRGPPLKAQDDYFRRWAEDAGIEYTSLDANYDVNKQIADIDSLVQQGVDVLFVWPIDPVAVQPALDRAREAGIHLVVEETSVGGPFFLNVQHDNVAAGAQAADLIADSFGQDAQVAAVLAPQQVEALNQRNEGFEARAEELGLDIVERQTAQQLTTEEAAAFGDGFKERHPDIDAVFAATDLIALGIAPRLGGSFTPAIVSIDAYEPTVELVGQGLITATLDPQYVETAKVMAWGAEAALRGGTVPDTVWIDHLVIDEAAAMDWPNYQQRIDTASTVTLAERDGRQFATVAP
jgi:ribose transport system substrate-binding protein